MIESATLRHDEAGMAMAVTVMVVFVCVMLTGGTLMLVDHNLDISAVDRKRMQAVAAADAGVDVVLNQIETATGKAQLPCSVPQTNLATGPLEANYTVTISYFADYPPSGAPLTCTAGTGPALEPKGVLITSLGDTQSRLYGKRQFEALVNLTEEPHSASSFNFALFSDTLLTMANTIVINGSVGGGNNGDVYANGNILCQNPATIYGSLYAQGSIQATAKCNTLGRWWSTGNISDASGSSIAGGITASAGSISFSNQGSSSGDVAGSSSVTCAKITVSGGHTCRQNQSGLVNPTYYPLPQLGYVPSAWQAAGYTVNADTSDCANAKTQFTNAIMAAGSNQVIRYTGNCSGTKGLVFSGDQTHTLYHDVAIISDNGIDATGKFNLQSGDGQTHKVYFIVPYSAGTTADKCGSTYDKRRIWFENETWWSAQVQFFAYTQCDATMANRGTGAGQVYAGRLAVQNSFTLNYAPGVVPGDPAAVFNTYSANLVYKREVQAG